MINSGIIREYQPIDTPDDTCADCTILRLKDKIKQAANRAGASKFPLI